MNKQLTVIGAIPVGPQTRVHLLADGPWDRSSMERLIAQLSLQLSLDAFGVAAEMGTAVGAEICPSKDGPSEASLNAGGRPGQGAQVNGSSGTSEGVSGHEKL